MSRREWHLKEEEFLIENYDVMTIKEIIDGLKKLSHRNRTADSINAKIKRLKADGKITGYKKDEVILRSLIQRRKDYERESGKPVQDV
jgi:rRNA-processing protein FCF1